MWGHLNVLHPTKWQQHHLQVEQVSCQVACALSNVKAHSREERTYRKFFVLLLQPKCSKWQQNQSVPLLFGNHLQARLHGVHTGYWNTRRSNYSPVKWNTFTTIQITWCSLPINTSWSLSKDLTSSSQGLDASLDLSYGRTKGRKKMNNGAIMWQCRPCVNSPWSFWPIPQPTHMGTQANKQTHTHSLTLWQREVLTAEHFALWDGYVLKLKRLSHCSTWMYVSSVNWPQCYFHEKSSPTKVLFSIIPGRKRLVPAALSL